MQIVKKQTDNRKAKSDAIKLAKGLMYSKGILEHQLSVAKISADTCANYFHALENEIKTETDPFKVSKLRYEMLSVKAKTSDVISQYKEFGRKYESTKDRLERSMAKESFEQIEFKNLEEEAKELVKYEIYGKVIFVSEDRELPKIIKEIEDALVVLENRKSAILVHLKSNDLRISNLEKTGLEKELFELTIHQETLNKRLSKRKEYYIEQFLPVYEKDMAESKVNLERFLGLCKIIIESGLDLQLSVLLSEHEKDTDKEGNAWIFYTALRTRLTAIATQLARQKVCLFPEILEQMRDLVAKN